MNVVVTAEQQAAAVAELVQVTAQRDAHEALMAADRLAHFSLLLMKFYSIDILQYKRTIRSDRTCILKKAKLPLPYTYMPYLYMVNKSGVLQYYEGLVVSVQLHPYYKNFFFYICQIYNCKC